MIITSKLTDDELIKRIHLSAAAYSKLLDKTFLIIGKNKKSPYFWFECYFRKKHFMHLLGIKSKTLSAEQFYDKCNDYNNGIGTGIAIEDCTPSRNHSRMTINQKCSCCSDMLRLQDARYMKVGLSDKISRYVDFTYAYGAEATLGFQKDNSGAGFPLTLIPRNIDEFLSQKYKIIIILEKQTSGIKFDKLLVEIKKGIFIENSPDFPEDLAKKIYIKN